VLTGRQLAVFSGVERTSIGEASDHGYPMLRHLKRLVDGEVIWEPATAGAFVLTTVHVPMPKQVVARPRL
jgi:uncharacterized linocin/CFP29 family protein